MQNRLKWNSQNCSLNQQAVKLSFSTMFADIFADKSDNIFLDPRRYIRGHDICNIGSYYFTYSSSPDLMLHNNI